MTAKKKTTTNPNAASVVSAIDAAAEKFETAADTIKSNFDAAIKTSTEQAKAAQAFEGVDFPGRDQFDAAVKAGENYVSGLQELNDLFFKTAKDAMRFNAEAAKSLSECSSPEDIAQAQMKLAQSGFEAAVEASNTINQAALKVAGDLGSPMAAQFGDAYKDLVSKTAA